MISTAVTYPRDVVLADLDGDADSDLVVVGEDSDGKHSVIEVLTNNGGVFGSRFTATLHPEYRFDANYPSAAYVVDADGDGILDVAVHFQSGEDSAYNVLQVWRQDGAGTFAALPPVDISMFRFGPLTAVDRTLYAVRNDGADDTITAFSPLLREPPSIVARIPSLSVSVLLATRSPETSSAELLVATAAGVQWLVPTGPLTFTVAESWPTVAMEGAVGESPWPHGSRVAVFGRLIGTDPDYRILWAIPFGEGSAAQPVALGKVLETRQLALSHVCGQTFVTLPGSRGVGFHAFALTGGSAAEAGLSDDFGATPPGAMRGAIFSASSDGIVALANVGKIWIYSPAVR